MACAVGVGRSLGRDLNRAGTDAASPVAFPARRLRKRNFPPRDVVVASGRVRGRARAFAADVTLNGACPFRRSIRPWGEGSDAFFFNLTAPQGEKAGLDANDPCTVALVPLD